MFYLRRHCTVTEQAPREGRALASRPLLDENHHLNNKRGALSLAAPSGLETMATLVLRSYIGRQDEIGETNP